MSDHLDAPGMKSPRMDARLDITDIFAFQQPDDRDRSVFVLNVNPLAPTLGDSFAPAALYELLIDTDGDARADIAYRVAFSPVTGGTQRATVRRATGTRARSSGEAGDLLFADAWVSLGEEAHVAAAGDYRFFAGLRSDPFFFDLDGLHNDFVFTGHDTFVDKNVSSIVLELPNAALGEGARVGYWCRVLLPEAGSYHQIDRMGRPLMNVLFTKGEEKNSFNHSEPDRDRELFLETFTTALQGFGHDAASARGAADDLLPDILPYDSSNAAGYPNGRGLTDDIIDIQLTLATNGRVTGDKVGPHTDLLTSFPYLGAPHQMAVPTATEQTKTVTV